MSTTIIGKIITMAKQEDKSVPKTYYLSNSNILFIEEQAKQDGRTPSNWLRNQLDKMQADTTN